MQTPGIKRYITNYMEEEYGDIGAENRFVGRFIFKNTKGRVLDFGCGPNLLFWSILMQNADRIDAFDIFPENIEYVKSTIVNGKKAPIYDKVLEYARRISKTKDATLADAAGKIKRLEVSDMLGPIPFSRNAYDTVTEIGSIGCVDTERDLLTAVANMHYRLKRGGRSVFVNWFGKRTGAPEKVPQFGGTVPISKAVYRRVLTKAGFKDIRLAYKRNPSGSEFATIIYGTARK